jgi:hypothetical protein
MKKMNPAVGKRKKRLKARLSLRGSWRYARVCDPAAFRRSSVQKKKFRPGAAGEIGFTRTYVERF